MNSILVNIKTLFLFFFFLLMFSCSELTDPVIEDEIVGLHGAVTDSVGQVIEGVEIFCLYYTQYLPEDIDQAILPSQPNNTSNFEFSLEQNFPNPFLNTTFVRYSLPVNSEIQFSIVNKFSGETVYQFTSNQPDGYYQHYLKNIVDSLHLQNGLYSYKLIAKGDNDTNYTGEKELLVISDQGEPNCRSDLKGEFTFDYKQTSAGDSVVVKYQSNYSYINKLTDTVFLLFYKEGYKQKIIEVTLYPNILLEHDVVLTRE